MTFEPVGDAVPPIISVIGWKEFRAKLLGFAQQSRERRSQLLFRGQANANWPLKTTLDRFRSFPDDSSRSKMFDSLLDEFRREAIVLRYSQDVLPSGEALELIARHHGLPSPLLDWTESPYIAGHFAFEGKRDPGPARVWVLDRSKLFNNSVQFSDFDLIDDRMLLRFNRRAIQQKSVFLRVNTIRKPLLELLSSSINAFNLDSADRSLALADLDVMNVNGATLFDDFDGVARTVTARIA